ncbi:hypothetical protein GZOEXZXM_CDS0007 [Salmonella phage SeKF_64]
MLRNESGKQEIAGHPRRGDDSERKDLRTDSAG